MVGFVIVAQPFVCGVQGARAWADQFLRFLMKNFMISLDFLLYDTVNFSF